MNKIIDLKNIEYLQADINKELVFDNQQSSLTLMSLRQGTERKLHTDQEDEAVIVIEGNVTITIRDGFQLHISVFNWKVISTSLKTILALKAYSLTCRFYILGFASGYG